MPSWPITKYECRICVIVRCPECDWTSPQTRPIPCFSPCMDCGAEWWQLISRPAKHRQDHDHLQPFWTRLRGIDKLYPADGKKRGRGRPKKS